MDTIKGVSQLFIKQRDDNSIALFVAKITDDLVFARTT